MSGVHPRDELGRVLPLASWPADRHAPGELELVRRFCNSINRENGAERFGSTVGVDRWLGSEGLEPVHASRTGLARVIGLREALHRLVVANATGVVDPGAWDSLAAVAGGISFHVARHRDGVELQPTGPALDVMIGRLLTIVMASRRDGSWPRLKACLHCHWVVFDPSKNRSSRWCSMTACGGRHNAREYRRRQHSAG